MNSDTWPSQQGSLPMQNSLFPAPTSTDISGSASEALPARRSRGRQRKSQTAEGLPPVDIFAQHILSLLTPSLKEQNEHINASILAVVAAISALQSTFLERHDEMLAQVQAFQSMIGCPVGCEENSIPEKSILGRLDAIDSNLFRISENLKGRDPLATLKSSPVQQERDSQLKTSPSSGRLYDLITRVSSPVRATLNNLTTAEDTSATDSSISDAEPGSEADPSQHDTEVASETPRAQPNQLQHSPGDMRTLSQEDSVGSNSAFLGGLCQSVFDRFNLFPRDDPHRELTPISWPGRASVELQQTLSDPISLDDNSQAGFRRVPDSEPIQTVDPSLFQIQVPPEYPPSSPHPSGAERLLPDEETDSRDTSVVEELISPHSHGGAMTPDSSPYSHGTLSMRELSPLTDLSHSDSEESSPEDDAPTNLSSADAHALRLRRRSMPLGAYSDTQRRRHKKTSELSPKRTVSVPALNRKRKPGGEASTKNTKKQRLVIRIPRFQSLPAMSASMYCQWPEKVKGDVAFQRQFVQCDKSVSFPWLRTVLTALIRCDLWYHYGCVGFVPDDIRLSPDAEWSCPPCETFQYVPMLREGRSAFLTSCMQ
ncbi:hypothetical protein BC834DRAFT_895214 [Gloeopeniophorella convolvens]|nr:hypothetical protein BC834DRAFT_895214 [Gloeopeniophorella convolvens]